MTDSTLTFNPAYGTSTVLPTGEMVINAIKDIGEMTAPHRHLAGDDVTRISAIHGRELVFQATGKVYRSSSMMSTTQSVIPVFAAFNGVTNRTEADYKLVGYARSSPALQGQAGREMSGAFAVAIGGTVTIVCNSPIPLPVGCRVRWCIPQTPGLPEDRYKKGRLLAELREFKPSEVANVEDMHRIISGHINGFDTSRLGTAQREKIGTFLEMWQCIKMMVFTGVVQTSGNMSSQQKLAYAAILGLVTPDHGTKDYKKQSRAAQADLLDAIFQKTTDKNGNSHTAPDIHAFAGENLQSKQIDVRKKQLARLQRSQMSMMITSLSSMLDQALSTVIGFTPSGGIPGEDMDIVLSKN